METTSFPKRILSFLAFAVPVAYIGTLVTVIIHEIIGHGLTGILIGGKATGLLLRADGFGSVLFSEFPNNIPGMVAMFLAGPLATLVVGSVAIIFAWIWRKSYFLSLTLLILGANMLLEGPPYLFWNAYNHIPPGDVGKIFELIPSTALMNSILIVGGIVTLVSIILVNIAFVKMAERWIGNGIVLTKGKRFSVFLLIFLMQATSWFIFDWNLLAPGLGQLPNLVGVGCTLLVLIIAWFRIPSSLSQDESIRNVSKWISGAWITLIIIVTIILVWFQTGIKW